MSQLVHIQFLRAIAAMMVVFGHAQHDALVWSDKTGAVFTRSHLLPWGAGVDLFFVISGFIMVYASRDAFGRPGAAQTFAKRRVIRIVPLYWLMAALYLVTLVLQSRAIGKPLPAMSDVVAAFAFLPTDTFSDGFIRPFFTLGWTLNYEMFFYLCFALVLSLPRRAAVLTLAIGLAALVGLGSFTTPTVSALNFWSQPIILEFVLGMGLALALLNGTRLSGPIRVTLVIAAFTLLGHDFLHASAQPQEWITPNDFSRVLAWGLPAAMLVAAAVLGAPERKTRGPATRFGLHLGDASYALYLSHPFVIVIVRKAMLATGLFSSLGGWTVVLITMVAAIAVASALHLFVERPLTRWLNSRVLHERPAPTLSPQTA